jgi:cobalt-zinc-cadmium efflux system membrane fusion protein
MNRRGWWLLWGVACGAIDEARPPHEHEAHEEEAGHDDAHGEPLLEVSEAVLRDLRLTTAAARSGGAGEAAPVLGELTVDEGRYAEVGSPVAARVRRALVDIGDVVAAGAPLVELESAELGRARAALTAARARASVAARSAERKASLPDAAMSAAERERAVGEAEVAAAELAAAEATVAALGAGEASGGVFTVRSPMAGVVLSRDAHVGEWVDAPTTLVRVADVSSLWLVVHAFERDALRIQVGTTVDVVFAALPNRTVPGVVARVGGEVDGASRTVPVRVTVPNPTGELRPGMSATALLRLGDGVGAVTAPGMAVQRCEAGWCVFLPRGEGAFEQRAVGRGRDLGPDVEILSGLAEGEVVVVEGAFLLRAEAAKAAGGGDDHHH